MEAAVSRYEEALTVDAARYLLARGIDKELAVTFRLGVVHDPMSKHEQYEGWLAIPYLWTDGYTPLAVRFRCLRDHKCKEYKHGKYGQPKGSPNRIFNVGALTGTHPDIHVTEGEMDAIILTKAGLPAVAIPGAQAWADRHAVMLSGFQNVYVWADPDKAGSELLTVIEKDLRDSVRSVRLTEGDVNETYLSGGIDALHEALKRE